MPDHTPARSRPEEHGTTGYEPLAAPQGVEYGGEGASAEEEGGREEDDVVLRAVVDAEVGAPTSRGDASGAHTSPPSLSRPLQWGAPSSLFLAGQAQSGVAAGEADGVLPDGSNASSTLSPVRGKPCTLDPKLKTLNPQH